MLSQKILRQSPQTVAGQDLTPASAEKLQPIESRLASGVFQIAGTVQARNSRLNFYRRSPPHHRGILFC
jgi:hypothetical protein